VRKFDSCRGHLAPVQVTADQTGSRWAMNPVVSRGDSRRLATEAPYNVDDYETWRKVYDQFYGERGAMGVMGAAAFQSVDDPNELTVWHDFETSEVARAFVPSDALRNVVHRAGVQGEPQFWFVTESWRPAPAFASRL
jgi:hypothetical protein